VRRGIQPLCPAEGTPCSVFVLTKAHSYSTLDVHTMSHRAHIFLPEDLLRDIDALVGPRGRSAFLAETARNEVRRQKLLRFLESKQPSWRDADHPELAGSSAGWVRTIRRESKASRSPKHSHAKRRAARTR
jgi:hypothetical protein